MNTKYLIEDEYIGEYYAYGRLREWRLDAEGNSLSELLESATVAIVDENGNEIISQHASMSDVDIRIVEKEIEDHIIKIAVEEVEATCYGKKA